MADKNQNVPWKDVVSRVSADSGIPKKNIDEVSDALQKGVSTIIKETRPTEIGATTKIKTPLGVFTTTLKPEKITQNPKTGEQFIRSSSYSVGWGVPKDFVDAANSGITITSKPLAGGKTVTADKEKTSSKKAG